MAADDITRNKAGKILKEPRAPSVASLRDYTTKSYPRYDVDIHSTWKLRDIPSGDIIQKDMMGYPLWIDEWTTAEEIPTNCRIDDFTLARLIDARKTANFYHERWPVEFDGKKMVKAVRMPLGFAAKMWVNKGDKDRHGDAAPEAGWYYKWYRGLHLLCGEEGINQYKHRPSHQDMMKDTWYFDLDYKCMYQDDEHGDEETEEVMGRIGSKAVAALVPIQKGAAGSRKGKEKEGSRKGKEKDIVKLGETRSMEPKGERSVEPEKTEGETPRKAYKPMKSKAIVDSEDGYTADDEGEDTQSKTSIFAT